MNILSIGEILWDVVEGDKHLGGAPFNLLAHIRKMGHRCHLYSAIGNDQMGEELLKKVNSLGVIDKLISKNDYPTGKVTVQLQDGQPEYEIHEPAAWDYLSDSAETLERLSEKTFDLVVFGILAQRNEENAARIYEAIKKSKAGHIFFDINIRKEFYTIEKIRRSLELCSMLKLNEDELSLLRSLMYTEQDELRSVVEKISKDFDINLICITRGGDGAWAFGQKKWYKSEAPSVDVADTIGAGDSFSAAFLHTYLRTHDISESLDAAVQLGAYVASQSGAIPSYTREIKSMLGIG